MDKMFIKALLEEGRIISDIPQEEALTRLNNDIMTVYVMNGLHRSMQPEAFKEEVRTCAVAMFHELSSDPRYKTIRDREISYIFSNGMKGRLNDDRDIGLTYKNLIRWVEGYVKHHERREALAQFYEDHRPKAPQLPPHVITDDDYARMVNDAWSDWMEYKKSEERCKEAIKNGSVKSKRPGPKTIDEIVGFPIACQDYGKVKIHFLVRLGMAKEGDKLTEVFERAWLNGLRNKMFIKK